MSYDIYIADECFNYTFNTASLFYDHIPTENSRGGLHELDGLTGRQAGLLLSDAFEGIDVTVGGFWRQEDVGEPRFCSEYDSDNGWGSAVGALVFLSRVMAACFKHPRHTVRVCA